MTALPSRMAARASGFATSIFSEMSALARAHNAVNLAQGFPDFPSPPWIRAAAERAIAADANQYAISYGATRLRHALAAQIAAAYDLAYDPEAEITVTSGATEAICTTLLALVNPGDEVVAHCLSVELESPDGHNDTMMDPEQRIWGFETNFGGLAEIALVKSNQLMPKPAHLTWEEAAAPTLTGTSPRPTRRSTLPVLRATCCSSTLPATQVAPRRFSSGAVAAMSSATMSSMPVSTSRMTGRRSGVGTALPPGAAASSGPSIGANASGPANPRPGRPSR